MSYRIAVGGIHIESSTFTPYVSGYKDFTVRRGAEFMFRYPWYEKYREKADLLPLIHTGALPGGVVDRIFFEDWLHEFLELLTEAKKDGLNGVLLDIHGAMSVQGMKDAEGYVAKEVRRVIGKDVLLSTSMDLHGNVTDDLFVESDLITCYRTAPHIDIVETRERAFANLLLALENKEKTLYKTKVDIPILLPGEKTSTEVSPGKELYEKIPSLCDGDILDASIWMGFPWADEERCHAVVCSVGFEKGKVKAAAEELAQNFWEKKEEFAFVGPTNTMEGAIEEALNSDKKPFFLSDTGDNPGAGGAGDMNVFLRGFLNILKDKKTNKKILFASICDSDSIEKIYSFSKDNKEGKLSLALGGKMDLSFGGPVSIDVEVKHLFEDRTAGRGALVQTGQVAIVVTEHRFQFGAWKSFEKAGLRSFDDFDIIIVKMGYLEPDLSKAAKGWVMALTPGAVCQDIVNIPYRNLKHPLYPFDIFSEGKASLLHIKCGERGGSTNEIHHQPFQ